MASARRKFRLKGFIAAAAIAAAGLCATANTALAAPSLLVTIAQIGEPLGRMLAGCAKVETLLGPGVDPHLYRLTRTDVAKALAADGVIANGLNLEAQMRDLFDRLAARKPVIFAAELLDDDSILKASGAPDPHVWMDPGLWTTALTRAADKVAAAWPDCAAVLAANRPAVIAEIERTDRYMAEALATVPQGRRVLITAHDAFTYFGRRYQMEVLGVQGLSTESEAGVAHIRSLAERIARDRVTAVFAETSTSARAVAAVIEGARALGANVSRGPALFSDAMGPPGSYEGGYVGMLDHNATAVARALGGEAPASGMNGKLAIGRAGKEG